MPRVRRGLRTVTAPAAAPVRVRAAIYTRKSTDEGLDRNFSSLDNQRERAEAYIASQGWVLTEARYDDGGFSGGNTSRPALQRLLADVEAGLIEVIVVYKLDRLSRSLLDFLNIHRFLEQHGVAVISVTEPIDTTTPMGRGFVNVLLSFAQIEREVAAERTRDKICAARRRGKWTGGRPPLGYDTAPEGGRLLVNKEEADQVRAIFELYVETPSLIQVAKELNRRGWTTKAWTTKSGNRAGGTPWNKSTVRQVLTNALYVGKQKLGDETFKGEHKAIVRRSLFNRVQDFLKSNRSSGGAAVRNQHGFLLRGLLRCTACDSAMTPSWTRRRNRIHRYYRCSHSEKNGHSVCPSKMLPADKVERFVVDQIKRIGTDRDLQDETFRQAVAEIKAKRRGLKLERTRLERCLTKAHSDVQRLVDTISRTTGSAADAISAGLGRAQKLVQTLENRQAEIKTEMATLKTQVIDRDHLARALEEFDEIWSALLTPERERVLNLLIHRIDYNGDTQHMTIHWRLSGFGELADEVSP